MARAKTAVPEIAVADEPQWTYGVRTWNADGTTHGGFAWDLTVGARTEAPDWSPVAECGQGLHCNPEGLGDWSLLSKDPSAVLGIVRYDRRLAVDLDGKIKAPFMEIVTTTQVASRSSIMARVAKITRDAVVATVAEAARSATATVATKNGEAASAAGDSGHASAAGYRGHASAAGHSGHASAAGYRGHASAAGDRGHASAAGKFGISAALGIEGRAMAAETGAIMLSAWKQDKRTYAYSLAAVFAGMVGQTYGGVTIEPGVYYSLGLDGVPVAHK